MNVTLYKSALCPRCHMARRHLLGALHGHGEVTVDEVDILISPQKSWQQGIRMIPALKIDGDILSAAYLTRQQITDFIDSHLEAKKATQPPNTTLP